MASSILEVKYKSLFCVILSSTPNMITVSHYQVISAIDIPPLNGQLPTNRVLPRQSTNVNLLKTVPAVVEPACTLQSLQNSPLRPILSQL